MYKQQVESALRDRVVRESLHDTSEMKGAAIQNIWGRKGSSSAKENFSAKALR